MFTSEQLKAAHGKVKSGADFPAYIREIKTLGVHYYETFVADGHTVFYNSRGEKTYWPAKYEVLEIAAAIDPVQFKNLLKEHQQGKSDYMTFITQSARSGIEKWVVRLDEMTCTYYDKSGNEILVEEIPG